MISDKKREALKKATATRVANAAARALARLQPVPVVPVVVPVVKEMTKQEKTAARIAKGQATKAAKRQHDLEIVGKTKKVTKPKKTPAQIEANKRRTANATATRLKLAAERKAIIETLGLDKKKLTDKQKRTIVKDAVNVLTTAAKEIVSKEKTVKVTTRQRTTKPKKTQQRAKVGEPLTEEDIIQGKLPDKYPFYFQPTHGDKRHPKPAVLFKNDNDVKKYLRNVETADTRAAEEDNIASDSEEIDQDVDAFLNELANEREYSSRDDDDDEGLFPHPQPQTLRDVIDSDEEREVEKWRKDKYGDHDASYEVDSPTRGGGGMTFGGGCTGAVSACAKSQADNCLLRIIASHGVDTEKVYSRYPHLQRVPGSTDPIYITHDEMGAVSKMLRVNINVYSRLGSVINKPWHKFENGHCKTIRVVIEDGHAFMLTNTFDIDNIVYGPVPLVDDIDGIAIKHAGDHAIVIHDGRYTMFKEYKVSTITGKPEDDYGIKNAYIFNTEQYMFKLFKKVHDLETIHLPDIRKIVKVSEHFIGNEVFHKITPDTRAVDHNKSYVSYKSSKYYMGFPGNVLGASLSPQPACSPYKDVFVALKDIKGMPWVCARMLKYTSGPIVLAMPMYNYLKTVCSEMVVDYWLASTTKDIDIVKFTDEHKTINDNVGDHKRYRNALIGKCIAGGIREGKKVIVKTASQRERDQVIGECRENGLSLTVMDDGNLSIKYKAKSNGLFQFHSYILAYAATQLMEKACQLITDGCTFVGFNVDCLLYVPPVVSYDPTERSLEIGGWKAESLEHKSLFKRLKVSTLMDFPERVNPQPVNMDTLRYFKNTLIVGPPGIGKSHEFKTNPLFDQILTTPTRTLREEHKAGQYGFANTYTTHKYIQFSVDEDTLKGLRRKHKVPRVHKTLIVDEFTMFNQSEWKKIIDRSNTDKGGCIIAIGDHEQIRKGIDAPEVNIEYFKAHGFDVVYLDRQPDVPARHTYEEGCILDRMRIGWEDLGNGASIAERRAHAKKGNDMQVDIIRPYLSSVDNIYDIVDKVISADHCDVYVSDTHSKLHDVNVYVRDYCIANGLTFPVNNNKGRIIRIPADSPSIWWGRMKMDDVMPSDGVLKYEPAFAVTGDSIEGSTKDCKVYVDTNMSRPRVFYTACTRTKRLADTVLVNNSTRYVPIVEQMVYTVDEGRRSRPLQYGCFDDVERLVWPKRAPHHKPKKSTMINRLKTMCDHLVKRPLTEPETFCEQEVYVVCTDVMLKVDDVCAKVGELLPRVVPTSLKSKLDKRFALINAANAANVRSDPVNMQVHNTLADLARKCCHKKDWRMTLFYLSDTVFNTLLSLHSDIDLLSTGVIKSVGDAVRINSKLYPKPTIPDVIVLPNGERFELDITI
jgi:hypothetical protein